ncbi:MAG: hypothetical protein IPM82_21615 [Saprospiraceae bacterium]|nr:hypothetical protein [Saprospiraceae bacterium]
MKNLSIAIITTLVSIISLNAQPANFTSMKRNAITVAPYRAFTQKGEIQFGYEKQESKMGALELNLGFRFKGSDDPKLDPYFNQTLVSSSVAQVHRGVQFFLFLPIPVLERDDDWTEKPCTGNSTPTTTCTLSGGYKFYLVPTPNRHVPGGLYLTPGLTIGNRGISEYIYAEGQKGYMTELDENWSDGGEWGPIVGFVGNVKVVQEDIYDFTRLEIKQYSKTYLQPHLKMGLQLPIADRFSLDLGGQATFRGKLFGKSNTSIFKLEPTVKLGMWF